MPWITGATVTRDPRDPDATVARAVAFFIERGLGWDRTAAGEVAAAIGPAAEAAGLIPEERRPAMILAPLAGEPPHVPGLTIETVRDTEALADFIATSTAGFGSGAELLFRRMYEPAMLAAPDLALYTSYLDGEPVATAVRTTAYRIGGIGEAITARAALDGLADSCLAAFLQATAMGYRLYERMGYRHVIDIHTWRASAV